jgi:hypothetical protein
MLARSAFRILSFAVVAAVAAPTYAFSPPPPPPAFIDDIARQLLPNPSADNFDRYAALLASDLEVTLNGHRQAKGKPAWLAIERQRLGKVDRFVYGYSEGRDSILIMDRFDDRSDEHCPSGSGCVFDPRWHARAVRFDIGPDRLVHAIRILETDNIFVTPKD